MDRAKWKRVGAEFELGGSGFVAKHIRVQSESFLAR